MARRIADSEPFRWFIGITNVDRVKSPSKSTIKRMEQIWSVQDIETLIHDLNKKVSDPAHSLQLLKMVLQHAETYYQLLQEKWHTTEWTERPAWRCNTI